jgi:DNA-binding NtrC family response regulator
VNQRLSFSQTAKVGSRQLLVIEENAEDCALMTFVLAKELPGFEIVRVADEDTFAQLLGRHAFDAVVTEHRLTWTDGFHVLDRVHGLLPKCPVILFTSSGSEELVRQALKSGFADYVTKSPRGYLRLVRRIEACLESSLSHASNGERAHPDPEINRETNQSIELLHAVSHDLQEPLRGISRFSRLL